MFVLNIWVLIAGWAAIRLSTGESEDILQGLCWWQYSSGTIHIISAKIRNNVHGATTALSDAERVAVAVMLH